MSTPDQPRPSVLRYFGEHIWPFGTWPFGAGAWWKHTRWWAWMAATLLLAAYIWAGAIPRYYLGQMQAPPFEQLQRMEGTLIFKHIRGKNGGYQIGLEMPDGNKEFFTCSVGFGTPLDCVLMTRVNALTGKPGVIWWFPLQDRIDHTRRYGMQVAVSGTLENSPERRQWIFRERIEWAKVNFLFMTYTFGFLIYVILWKGSKKMDKQALDTLQAGLAQAETPTDMAALINSLASGPSSLNKRGQARISYHMATPVSPPLRNRR
ncbi:MAG: hypothetical protein PHX10_11200 [Gallionellaceae bacterium]|nr:hypothetical protein [Gallionellaceae bacterium]